MTTEARARKFTATFRMECSIECRIEASAKTIWALLTDAEGFPRWNKTVTELRGPIELGNRLAIKVPVSERTFTPRVTEFVPESRMVWSDGMMPMFQGVRTFTLSAREDGTTDFSMVEVFRGMMLPMIRGGLPDFGPIFEQYARDLKKAAEGSSAA